MSNSGASTTIMLVDNDTDFLDLTCEFLEQQGYRVLAVDNATAARHYLASEVLALALIDYRLEDDGDDRDETGLHLAMDCQVPTIMLTSFKDHEYVRRALRPRRDGRSIADDYVVKQDGFEALQTAITRVLATVRVFLSYARQDRSVVDELYTQLSKAGLVPWMDIRDLTGGEKWKIAIQREITRSDFFILCLSSRSVSKRGYIQREIRLALQVLDELLDEDIFLIPVRLEDCSVEHERLQELQWIDMHSPSGLNQLLTAIQTGMSRRS